MICSFCDILLQILGIGGQLLENQMDKCVCHMSHMSHIDIKYDTKGESNFLPRS